MFKIGMRNIKTSISVFLCLLIFQLFNRENAIQACIAAVICMQNTVVDSFKRGTDRVIGTIIGGIMGGFVLFLLTSLGKEDLLIFIIPLGMAVLIEICVSINMKQSVVISCVIYLIILTSKNQAGGYVLYTLNRVIDTTIGIMIALFVNKYMNLPPKLKELLVRVKIKKEPDDDTKNIISESKEDFDENIVEDVVPDIENNKKIER